MVRAAANVARRGRPCLAATTGTSLSVSVCVLLLTSCVSTPRAPVAPPPDAGQVARAAGLASAFDVPYRLLFEWSINEPGSRLGGRGVARIEPPASARLDLFSSNGERVAAAALNGDSLRVANDVQMDVPPAPLLWGALGVFRPGPAIGLAGGRRHPGGELELQYQDAAGTEFLYMLRDSRIQHIDVQRDGRTSEEVALVRQDGERFPRQATYRHLEEVRELRITLESVEHVESYPMDIFDLGL